ncbi:MAG: hypothetical protein ACP5QZ_04710 [Candidatus Sumerlaeaceae bacterium]
MATIPTLLSFPSYGNRRHVRTVSFLFCEYAFEREGTTNLAIVEHRERFVTMPPDPLNRQG